MKDSPSLTTSSSSSPSPTSSPSLQQSKILIIGGGITGLASAYTLARQGAHVTVIEKEAHVASAASSQSSSGFLFFTPYPLFLTGLSGFVPPRGGVLEIKAKLVALLKHGPGPNAELLIPPFDRGVLPWALNFLDAAFSLAEKDAWARKRRVVGELLEGSRAEWNRLVGEADAPLHQTVKVNPLGALGIYHTREQISEVFENEGRQFVEVRRKAAEEVQEDGDSGGKGGKKLHGGASTTTTTTGKKGGDSHNPAAETVVMLEEALRLEPGLIGPSKEDLYAGIFTKDFACTDPGHFASALATHCAEKYGVKFLTATEVSSLVMHPRKNRLLGVRTTEGDLIGADHIVLCTGAETNTICKSVGITLPIWPAVAHSVTLQVPESLRSLAPQRAVIDGYKGVLASRVGNTVRFVTLLKLSNEKVVSREWHITSMMIAARKMFPALTPVLLDRNQVEIRTGMFSLSPDGSFPFFFCDFLSVTNNSPCCHPRCLCYHPHWSHFIVIGVPIVSATKISNLFVNVGHGSNSLSLALGAGQVLSSLLLGHQHPDLSLRRFL